MQEIIPITIMQILLIMMEWVGYNFLMGIYMKDSLRKVKWKEKVNLWLVEEMSMKDNLRMVLNMAKEQWNIEME